MQNRFFFTAGIVGMLSGVASGATDGADVGYGREWNPYVTLRGGWLFGGKAEGDFSESDHPEINRNLKETIKNAWSGSVEFGVSCFDDWVFAGLELGYFTGKANFKIPVEGAREMLFPAEFGNTFAACNVTLRYPFGERGFWYGGIGAGIVRVSMTANMSFDGVEAGCGAKSLSFLGQGFAGVGWYLNDNWQLTVGYRLRYVPDTISWLWKVDEGGMEFEMEQDLSHAAEVGLMYRF